MKFKSFQKILALFLFFITPLAYSQILLVSDIDDTLKNSHVLDRSEMLANSLKTDVVFKGLPLAYKAISLSHPETHFAYVSNALELISKDSHTKFLKENQFPKGTIHFRQSLFDQNHKFNTISALIQKEKPAYIILIGDNGERDVEIYAAIKKAFPEKNILSIIHAAYNSKAQDREKKGKELAAGQLPFVGVIDLLSLFAKNNLISENHMMSIATGYMGSFITEKAENKGAFFVPYWIQCQDFNRFYSSSENQQNIHPFLRTGFDYLFKRCQRY